MTRDLPGFVDLQVNGFGGVDFNDTSVTPGEIAGALDRMLETGVTRCLPTLITSSLEEFRVCTRALSDSGHPSIAGFHMEGPYISPEDGPRGAHRRHRVMGATIDDFARRQEVCDGRIRLLTLAPEVPGAISLIEHLAGTGVRVAIGHTAATAALIGDAVKAGATLATHLGNGCAQMMPRHPNAIWELLAADDVYASLIVDGHHVPASTIKVMVRAKGPSKTILVTDAIAAAGCQPGDFTIGDVSCVLGADGRVSLPGTPYLAGSALTMERAIQNAVRFTGVTFDEAVAMASSIPAAYIGIPAAGSIRVEWDDERLELRILAARGDGGPTETAKALK